VSAVFLVAWLIIFVPLFILVVAAVWGEFFYQVEQWMPRKPFKSGVTITSRRVARRPSRSIKEEGVQE
jgi:hypothetical protein